MDLDVGGSALKAGERLVDHHACVRQRSALALRAGREQQAPHGRCLSHAKRRHGAAQALHRIVDRQAGGDVAAWRVDVHHDVLVGIFRFEEQQLRDHKVGEIVVDLTAQEYDSVVEQPREQVPSPFTPVCLLDDRGDQRGSDITQISSHRFSGVDSHATSAARANRQTAPSFRPGNLPDSASSITMASSLDGLLGVQHLRRVVGLERV